MFHLSSAIRWFRRAFCVFKNVVTRRRRCRRFFYLFFLLLEKSKWKTEFSFCSFRIRIQRALTNRNIYRRSSSSSSVHVSICNAKPKQIENVFSYLPSKQAARNGVECVFVLWFTLAPCWISNLITFRCPEPAAHQSAVAPWIMWPSNLTMHSCSIFGLKLFSNILTTL